LGQTYTEKGKRKILTKMTFKEKPIKNNDSKGELYTMVYGKKKNKRRNYSNCGQK
jgi:hypothetical protein